MRDWEEAHCTMKPGPTDQRPHGEVGRARKRSMEWTDAVADTFDEDDEDDIQIIHADTLHEGVPDTTRPRHCSRRKRARSEGDMDIDDLEGDGVCLGAGHNCASPPNDSSCLSSGYASDDDSSCSLTYTNSSNSSRASLPLHHASPMTTSQEHLGCPTSRVPSAASPSEKAIAALTLVMANGAGGINDYDAVLSVEAPRLATLDESLIGEMWN